MDTPTCSRSSRHEIICNNRASLSCFATSNEKIHEQKRREVVLNFHTFHIFSAKSELNYKSEIHESINLSFKIPAILSDHENL